MVLQENRLVDKIISVIKSMIFIIQIPMECRKLTLGEITTYTLRQVESLSQEAAGSLAQR